MNMLTGFFFLFLLLLLSLCEWGSVGSGNAGLSRGGVKVEKEVKAEKGEKDGRGGREGRKDREGGEDNGGLDAVCCGLRISRRRATDDRVREGEWRGRGVYSCIRILLRRETTKVRKRERRRKDHTSNFKLPRRRR